MTREVGKNFSKKARFMLSHDVTVPGANSYNQSFAFSKREKGKAFIFKILPSTLTGVMLEHTTSNSFKCLLGSSMDNPWYFGMWCNKLDFNSNSYVFPQAAAGYWIHRGAALSNPEAESSLIVRLSTSMSFSASSFSSNLDSELELGGLGSGTFLFLLKVRSKLSSNSDICARTG
ncbi:hypothetical protein PS1_013331 [Malus domestica]